MVYFFAIVLLLAVAQLVRALRNYKQAGHYYNPRKWG